MPAKVHPQIQALIDKAAKAGLAGLQTMDVDAARAQVDALSNAARTMFTPPEMFRVESGTTGDGFNHVPLRIYTPTDREHAPAIVYYHGGGHVVGNLDTHDTIARNLAKQTEAKVISVDYRLAPEHPFPAAVDDSYLAAGWVAQNAETLGIDPKKIALCGDSAGANLAAVTALAARDSGAFSITAQVLIYPVVDYRGGTESYKNYGTGYGTFGSATMQWFLEQYLPDVDQRDDWRANLRAARLSADLPPAYVLVAECDVLHDEGVEYSELLKKARSPSQV